MPESKPETQDYAVVATGGKQYLVRVGDTFRVETLRAEAGASVDLRPVLALSKGGKLQIGKPDIAGARVAVKVLEHVRGEKVFSFKKKRRKTYKRKKGHRQDLTLIRVEGIG